jgi:hypothetical protein
LHVGDVVFIHSRWIALLAFTDNATGVTVSVSVVKL